MKWLWQLRAGAREILKESSLFLLIRASGRHLWARKSFCGDKRDTSLWTESKERLCCRRLHFSTPCLAEAFLLAHSCLAPVVYLKTGNGVSVCTLSAVSLNAFLKTVPWEKFHYTFVSICESIYLRVPINSGDLTSNQTQLCPGITQTHQGTSFLSKYLSFLVLHLLPMIIDINCFKDWIAMKYNHVD